jgi:hypothetical protein
MATRNWEASERVQRRFPDDSHLHSVHSENIKPRKEIKGKG